MSRDMAAQLGKSCQQEVTLREREFCREAAVGEDFSHLDCVQVVFRVCRFAGTDFSHSFFDRVRWERCDLSGCRFSECSFRETAFLDCRGDGCSFPQSVFSRVQVEEGSWHCANFTKAVWKTGSFRSCRLNQGILAQMRHRNLTFQKVDLTGVDFFQTSLAGVDLSTCEIQGLTLSQDHRELRGAVLALEQAGDVAALLGIQLI